MPAAPARFRAPGFRISRKPIENRREVPMSGYNPKQPAKFIPVLETTEEDKLPPHIYRMELSSYLHDFILSLTDIYEIMEKFHDDSTGRIRTLNLFKVCINYIDARITNLEMAFQNILGASVYLDFRTFNDNKIVGIALSKGSDRA
jgi:hypothetical protein